MFVIFLNFLLLTLILYNFINSKTVEYFSGCSPNSKNAVYRQQSKTDILQSRINKLTREYSSLNKQSKGFNSRINSNTKLIRGKLGELKGEAEKMEKELDDIEDVENEGEEDLKRLSGKSVKVHSGNPVNAKNYANNLRGSGSSSRN